MKVILFVLIYVLLTSIQVYSCTIFYVVKDNKIFAGALMQKVIEECANIKEALEIFANYYCEDQYKAQYLIGDSLGNSKVFNKP